MAVNEMPLVDALHLAIEEAMQWWHQRTKAGTVCGLPFRRDLLC